MKKAGIWIDSQKAWIYTLENSDEEFEQVISEVEDTRVGGGYGGATPYGPQVANPDDKIMNRRDHQFNRFFENVSNKLKGTNEVLIEGPAEAKIGLMKFIKELSALRDVQLEMRTADKLTENQFRAEVKDYFDKK
ncbi:MAG: hypothetical protein HKN45_04915 [Flavobacteriales bacterium]|nr:hypothetical protein [Flavobacteriales bacterium]